MGLRHAQTSSENGSVFLAVHKIYTSIGFLYRSALTGAEPFELNRLTARLTG